MCKDKKKLLAGLQILFLVSFLAKIAMLFCLKKGNCCSCESEAKEEEK